MDVAVEISMYPFNEAYVPPIKDFIERLNKADRLKVVTNSLSTQVFGRYEDVFGVLVPELRSTYEQHGKTVFVMKVIGPLASV